MRIPEFVLKRLSMLGAVLVLICPRAARAADDEAPEASASRVSQPSFTDLTEQGLALYKVRDYRRAADRFLQAYAIDRDPNLLFNIARSYDALGNAAAAVEKYEAYLKAPGTDPSGRERAEKALRVLRHRAEPAGAPPRAQADDGRAPRDERPRPDAAKSDAAKGSKMPVVIGWVATAALAAGTAATGIFALDSANKLQAARETFPGNEQDIASGASKTTALTTTADALGIATLVMGAVSFYWTLNSSSSPLDLKAAIGPSGVKFAGSF